jgi:superfamily II DNA or RNA helicase
MAQILGHRWSFYEFRDIFYFSIRKGFREFWMPRKDQKERLGKAVRSLGYTGRLEDYFDVPEQTFRVEYFGLTKEQKQKLKEVETEFPDPLVQITKRHQVENGTLKGDEFSKDEFFDNEKIERLKDLAIEFPRLVIIAKYSNQIKQIAEALKEYNVLTLEGATKNRSELINKANRDEECIVIAQASVSAGWELPNYPVMVFASLSYSVVDRLQAIGRIHRANALKKNLYIDLVVKGGIDEEVYKAIQNKEDFVEHIYARKQK